ncbi:hypothetical protein, partial [Sinorhizobium meliloti]|uniref:hypothetical protein n=1 Tax=Rhizobium meliloti TaxID=382 RepID=UPI001AECD1AB
SAISNHPVPLLQMKELISRSQSAKKRWAVRRAHDLLIKAIGNKPRVVGFACGAELRINAFAGISRQCGMLW